MKMVKFNTAALILFLTVPWTVHASFKLNLKIDRQVGKHVVQVTKTINADFNKEILISTDDSKNKIALKLKKISNLVVDGNIISPVQIDMKLLNEMQKTIGRPQTVTSFYNHNAEFALRSSGVITDAADINISLNFEETN